MKPNHFVCRNFSATSLQALVLICSLPSVLLAQDSFSDISGATGAETKHLDGMVERDVTVQNSVAISSSAVSASAVSAFAPSAVSAPMSALAIALSSASSAPEGSSNGESSGEAIVPPPLITDSTSSLEHSLVTSSASSASFAETPAATVPPPMAITAYVVGSAASNSASSSALSSTMLPLAPTTTQSTEILSTPTPSRAELLLKSPSVSLIEYPVRGLSFEHINKDLDLFAAASTSGSKSDFGFAWNVTWEYTLDPVNQIPLVKVTPHFNVELPRWTEYDHTAPGNRVKWDSYRAALLRSIEARILLVQAFVPRAETDIKSFLVQNPKAKQLEIDDVLKKTTRLLQARLQGLQATEAGDFPRQPLIGIGAAP